MLKKDELIDAVLDGIINANTFYENISNGLWLNNSAVESVMQTKIAESIYDRLPRNAEGSLRDTSIVMEYQIRNIIDDSGSKKLRGRIPQLIGGAKRVDLLIVDKDSYPIVPIEIKKNAATDGFAEDAARIVGILRRSDTLAGGTVKYGLICGFIYGKGGSEEEVVADRKRQLDKSKEKIEIELPDHKYILKSKMDNSREFDGEWWAGGAVCVYLRRKTTSD